MIESMQQPGVIRVSGGRRLTIDIEGMIGVPEWWKPDDEARRAATYENFRAQIERIGRSGARRIQVNIRSTGGDVNDALLIYETLRERVAEGAEVTTLCYGYAASAATLVAQAASPGRRLVSPHALYLIHRSVTALEGNLLDAERAAQLLDKTDERMAGIYAEHSGRPADEFRKLMTRNAGRGVWLSAEEAVEAGLADRVYRSNSLSAVCDRMVQGVRDLFRREAVGGAERLAASVARTGTDADTGEADVVSRVAPADGDTGVVLADALREPDGRTVLSEEERRERVVASMTLEREDPSVAPAGLLGAPLPGQGELSRNGEAYERDAAYLRPNY